MEEKRKGEISIEFTSISGSHKCIDIYLYLLGPPIKSKYDNNMWKYSSNIITNNMRLDRNMKSHL